MDGSTMDASSCPEGQGVCGTQCVNPQTDHDNCGTCGHACQDFEVCSEGACQLHCPASQAVCGSRCVSTDSDHDNCGACDHACGGDEVCAAGHCAARCPTGFERCTSRGADAGASYCADLTVDRTNCGGCSTACGNGYDCVNGRCTIACPSGLHSCSARCVQMENDRNNCGACGNACMGSDVCSAGMCTPTCVAGQTDCAGRCIDPMRDTLNCGGCGMACPAGQVCTGGTCGITCATDETLCTDHCVNAQTDRFNCGACDHVCDPGQFCSAGACHVVCAAGTTACNGFCVNYTTDRNNCGSCGNACAAGQFCSGGACVMACQPSQTLCSGLCADTQVDSNNCGACGVTCAAGYACLTGFCQPLEGTDAGGCAAPSIACGGQCVDPRNDNANCGGCGMACAADRTCVLGTCVAPCNAGQGRCGLTCTNVSFDRTNCGTCGNTCAAGLSCIVGRCVAEPTLQVTSLSTTGCTVIAGVDTVAGDDRGGIAVSANKVFYTGDSPSFTSGGQTVSLNVGDLTGLAAAGQTHDALFSDAASQTVYVFLDATGAEITSTFISTFTATQLGILDATTGVLGTDRIPLTTPIVFTGSSSQAAIYAGAGRVIVFTGTASFGGTGTWYEIRLPSGQVTSLGTSAVPPGRVSTEGWASWGIAEYYGGERYVDYVSSSSTPGVGIIRLRLSDNTTTVLQSMSSVGDMASIVFSTAQNRWYFHFEASPDWTSGTETVGFCPATFTSP